MQRYGLVASHEQNLLPLSKPQSYAVLSPESKATEVAKKMRGLAYAMILSGAEQCFYTGASVLFQCPANFVLTMQIC